MTRRRPRARGRSRGFSQVSNVLEAAMVMGWFVALLVGERAVSEAASARRTAEDTAQNATSSASSAYCLEDLVPRALGMSASVVPNGKLDVARALSAIAALGIGEEKTFANYILPLLDVQVTARAATPGGRVFAGQRSLGCLERPLDTPSGSISGYRLPIWMTSLMGY